MLFQLYRLYYGGKYWTAVDSGFDFRHGQKDYLYAMFRWKPRMKYEARRLMNQEGRYVYLFVPYLITF
jgi:hypothetical protein